MGTIIQFDLWQEPEERLFGGWMVHYPVDQISIFVIHVDEKIAWAGRAGWAQYHLWRLVQFAYQTPFQEKMGTAHWNVLAEGRCLTASEAIQKGKAFVTKLASCFGSTKLVAAGLERE